MHPSSSSSWQQSSNPAGSASQSSSHQGGMFAPIGGPLRPPVAANRPLLPPPHLHPGHHHHHHTQMLGQPQPLGRRGGVATSSAALSSAAPQYGTTPRGEKYPADLGPYLQQGIPLKMSKACEDKNIQFFASKFPEGFDLSDLEGPFSIQRDVSQIEIAEDASSSMLVGSEDKRPINFRGGRDRDNNKPRKIDPTRLPWRLTDKNKKNLIGRRTDLDTSNYFVMVEKSDCIELVPLDCWYSFHTDLHSDGTAEPPSTDLAERKRRAALKMEEKAAARLASRIAKSDSDSDDERRPTKKLKNLDGDPMDSLYAEDGGLKRQQKKRLKSMIKSKKRGRKGDDEDVGGSALNLGELKRHEVDWDWDDDGKATDDEEDVAEDQNEDMDESKNDFNESDDEEQEVLTKFGQQVTSALENQKEQDADDELAQFSDDDDEEEKESTVASKGGDEEQQGEASSSSSVTSSTATKESAANGKKAAAATKDDATSVKQRVIRTLSLHGGRMPTKKFISTFNITSNTSDLFKFVRKSINEVCEVHTETINGEQVKVLELLPQFRPT